MLTGYVARVCCYLEFIDDRAIGEIEEIQSALVVPTEQSPSSHAILRDGKKEMRSRREGKVSLSRCVSLRVCHFERMCQFEKVCYFGKVC